MLLYRINGARKRNTRFSLTLFHPFHSSAFAGLSPPSSASTFLCLKQRTCYRESLRRVQSRWDCRSVSARLCCAHGMFPQRAYLSSRSWLNNAGSCFSPSAAVVASGASWGFLYPRVARSERVGNGSPYSNWRKVTFTSIFPPSLTIPKEHRQASLQTGDCSRD